MRTGAGVALGDVAQRQADALERLAEVLAPVRGDQDDARLGRSRSSCANFGGFGLGGDPAQRVDAGVAGDQDALGRHVLAQQVVARARGRREVAVGDRHRRCAD